MTDIITIQGINTVHLPRRLRSMNMREHAILWIGGLMRFYQQHDCHFSSEYMQSNLELVVTAASTAHNFVDACPEYEIGAKVAVVARQDWRKCVCGKKHLKKCHYITNKITGVVLMIGGICIKRFKKRDPTLKTKKQIRKGGARKRATPASGSVPPLKRAKPAPSTAIPSTALVPIRQELPVVQVPAPTPVAVPVPVAPTPVPVPVPTPSPIVTPTNMTFVLSNATSTPTIALPTVAFTFLPPSTATSFTITGEFKFTFTVTPPS